jgi:hypothetical protein
MATYYIDETTPQTRGASTAAGMDSMFQTLDRMGASRQRGKYYDYLNELQKQKLGAAKAKDREDAHIQKSANKQNEILFNNARGSLIDSREILGKNIAYLDKEIGFARFPGKTPEQIEAEIEFQQEKMADGTGLYTPAALTYPNQKPADRLEDYRKLLIDGTRWDGVESGTATAMLFNKLREALSQADDAVAADTKLSKYLQIGIPGSRPTVGAGGGSDFEFVPRRDQIKFFKNQYSENPFKGTRIEPGSADAADAATYGQGKAESPSTLPGGPLIGQEGYVTDVGPGGEGDRFLAYRDPDSLPEEAKRGITSEHVTPLESYPVPTGEVRPSGGLLPREMIQPADLEAAIRRSEQVAPQENPYLGIVDRNAFGLVDEPRPAVEGNRPIRLDQLQPPVDDVSSMPEYAPEAMSAVEGNRQMRLDQFEPPAETQLRDVNYYDPTQELPTQEQVSEWTGRPVRDYTWEDWFEANPDRPPVAEATSEGRLMRRGSLPRPDITPPPSQQEPTELNTFGGPSYIMRLLESPLMRRDGSIPTRGEVLQNLGLADEDVPSALENLEALDYEPIPGNPHYLPGGALYEEEE